MKLLRVLLRILWHAGIALKWLDRVSVCTLHLILPNAWTCFPSNSVTQLSVDVAHLVFSLGTYLLRSDWVLNLHCTCWRIRYLAARWVWHHALLHLVADAHGWPWDFHSGWANVSTSQVATVGLSQVLLGVDVVESQYLFLGWRFDRVLSLTKFTHGFALVTYCCVRFFTNRIFTVFSHGPAGRIN